MRIAYFDCFAGISGDMALGALLDAGADLLQLKAQLARLEIDDYDLTAEKLTKGTITATDVTVKLLHQQKPRRFSDIKRSIDQSGLSETVKNRSTAIFKRLGEAEAKIHSKSIEEVHFHEVGATDAIVDIVGTCICLDLLDIDKVYASPMPTFHGMVETAHGKFPLPAPATVEILKGVPWRTCGIEGEIVTPTGAAILAELADRFGDMPAMTAQSVGYGAGKKDFGIPNVLRMIVGEAVQEAQQPFSGEYEEVVVLETNIDDLSPQIYEVVMDRAFAAGALDVYLSPIQMKKNRPATLVSVICAPADTDKMTAILFEETSTIGIRIDTRRRICLPREVIKVKTNFGQIRVKVARRSGEVINVQPEYDDCKSAAAKSEVPVKMVRDTAIAAFYSGRELKADSREREQHEH